jgi:hypothetical protein
VSAINSKQKKLPTPVANVATFNSKRKHRLPRPDATADGLRAWQAAELANVSIGTIYNWLPLLKTWTVIRPGSSRGMRFVSRASLEELMKKMTREGL